MEEARTAFKNNPSQINRLDMIYQAADYMWAKGEHQEAAEQKTKDAKTALSSAESKITEKQAEVDNLEISMSRK